MATRRLVVEVVGDASSLSRTFRGASADSAKLGGSLGKLSIGLGQLAKGVIEVDLLQKAIEGLHAAVDLGIEGFTNTTKVAAQTAAVIKSTGDVSNLSAKQVHSLAAELSNVSGIDDEVIQSAENTLLAFTQIRDFAGKGNDIFTRATKVVTDYASRTGKAATSAATIIGRALADPATKAVALSRAGIVLAKSQLAALKATEKNSGVVAAQGVLLGDLEARYKGAAAAAGKTLPGQLDILRERFKDLAGDLVGDVLPAFSRTIGGLTGLVEKVTETQGFRAKLNIIWTGVEGAAKGAESAIGSAIAKVDWNKVWAEANGIADGLQKRLDEIDWTKVGKTIGDGIAKGVAEATGVVKPLAAKLDQAFQTAFKSIDFNKLGRAIGPGLAAAVVSAIATVLDPSFWLKNWDLTLAIAATAFSGGLGRIAGKFVAPFARLGAKIAPELADFGTEIALRLIDSLERVSPKLGTAADVIVKRLVDGFARGLSALAGVADRALAKLLGPFVRFYQRASGLTRFTIKVLGAQAAIDEVARVVSKIAGVFAGLADTIGHALDGAWQELERGAIKAALAIVDPFTHIPNQIVGNKFQDIKASLQAQLDGMVSASQTAVASIQAAFSKLPADPFANAITIPAQAAAVVKAIGGRNASAGFATETPQLPPVPAAPARKGLTAAQRNQFFDNAISSDLTRAGFLTSIKAQIAALQNIAGLISARLAATKDVTRRRTLEDQLLSVRSQIRSDQGQVGQDFLSTLQFGVTKAQATATFKDDAPAFQALEAGIRARIKATGDTLDLEQQLFEAVQGVKAAKTAQLSAKDFKILGFDPTGDDITPGLKRLRKEFASVTDAISGTSLDTSKIRTELARIKEVISDSLVPQDVRAKMQALLADLEGQLKKAGSQLGFKQLDTSKFAESLGLTGDAKRRAEAKLSQIGKGGTVPNAGVGAFGVAIPSQGDAGLRGLTITPSTVVVKVNENEIGRASMSWKISHDRRNPSQRRGPNAGH